MHGKQCILNNTTMTDAEKQEALKIYEQKELEFGSGVQTAEKVFDALKHRQQLRRKNRLLTAQKTVENILRIEEFVANSAGKRYGHAVQSFVAPDLRKVMNTFNLENRAKVHRNEILSDMADFTLYNMKKGLTGGRGKGFLGIHGQASKADMDDFIREAANIAENQPMSTGNKRMRSFAEAYLKSFDKAVHKINKAGGNIHKMDGWFIRQTHSSAAIAKATRSDYIEEVYKALDKPNIKSFETGQPLTEIELREIIGAHWDTMKNNGDQKPSVLPTTAQQTVNQQRQRIFKFKDFDAWKAYNDKYGDIDIFNSVVEHADKLGRQLAELEILGPQPQKTLENMIRYAEQAAAKNKGSTAGMERVQNFYDIYQRKHNLVTNEWIANLGAFGRGIATAAMLGKVLVSAAVDTAYTYNTARKVGMWGAKPIAKHIANISTFILRGMNATEKNRFLTNAGIIAEDAIFAAQVAQREAGDVGGGKITQVLGDWVMRAQGLTAWTNGLRHTLAMEMMGHLALNSSKTFDQLNAATQNALRRYELADSWDTIRKGKLEEYRGGQFMTKNSLRDIDPELATKYQEMLINIMDDGVVMNSIHATSATMFGKTMRRGSLGRETLAAATQFKTFPVAIYQRHLYGQLLEDNVNTKMFGMHISPKAARAYNAISTALLATALGAMVLQTRAILFGQQPRDYKDPEFWRESVFRGGGLGILEEVLREGLNAGTSIKITGPVGQLGADTFNLTLGNAYEYATGQDTDFTYELYNYMRKYNIVGNLWYTKLAFDRLVVERVAELMDPKIKSRVRRKIRRQRSQYGTKYWKKPFSQKADDIDWKALIGK